jgi:transposase InsO family protein
MPTTTRGPGDCLYLEAGADPPSLVAELADRKDGFSAEYVEGFYNIKRRHSALGHLSPSEDEGAKLKGGAVD